MVYQGGTPVDPTDLGVEVSQDNSAEQAMPESVQDSEEGDARFNQAPAEVKQLIGAVQNDEAKSALTRLVVAIISSNDKMKAQKQIVQKTSIFGATSGMTGDMVSDIYQPVYDARDQAEKYLGDPLVDDAYAAVTRFETDSAESRKQP